MKNSQQDKLKACRRETFLFRWSFLPNMNHFLHKLLLILLDGIFQGTKVYSTGSVK